MGKFSFVFVLSSFRLYGGVLYVIQCANRLVARGHVVQIFTPRGTVDTALAIRLDPSINIIECSSPLSSASGISHQQLKLFWSMAFELPQADIVVATHTPTAAPVLFARVLRRCMNYVHGVSTFVSTRDRHLSTDKRIALAWLYQDYPEMFRERYIERLLLRFAPRYFDAIWAVSNPLKETVEEHTNKPVVMCGNGLQMAELLLGRPRTMRCDGTRRVLYVGNGLPRKGLAEFLAAMRIVCHQYEKQGIRVVIAGAKDCTRLIEEYEISASREKMHIEFHERPLDPALCELYASSDLFVSASWGEGLGYPPLEAMACGTPVILTDSGGVRDYAQHEKNCLMVAPKDVKAMAAAIVRVLENKELATRLSKNGRKTVSRYDWKNVVERIEESAYQLVGHTYN